MTDRSVLARLHEANIVPEPFPHLVVEDALPAERYAALERCFPPLDTVCGRKPLASNRAYRMTAPQALQHPAITPPWREFIDYHCSDAFLRDLTAFWRASIRRCYPEFERMIGKPVSEMTGSMRDYANGRPQYAASNRRTDAVLDCQFVVNSPVQRPTSVRGPHLDRPYTLVAGLLYFRAAEDSSDGGDLEFYRTRGRHSRFDSRYIVAPQAVLPFRRISYAANTLVMWVNTPSALHGVTPRAATPHPRRYVNFVVDCYGLQTGTLFDVPMITVGRAKAWADRALHRAAGAVHALLGAR